MKCFVERIVTSTIILNALLVVPDSFAAIQGATVSSSAPLGGSPVAVGGNNQPNSGNAKVVPTNGKNNQLSETPTNSVNTGNLANGVNNPNANGNGLQSKDGDLASRTQTGTGSLQSNNGNNGMANNPVNARPGLVPNGQNGNGNSGSTMGNSNTGGNMGRANEINGNKPNNGKFGVTTQNGLIKGVTHHSLGTAAKQSQNKAQHGGKNQATRAQHGNGAKSMTTTSEIWTTFAKIFVAVIIPLLANKATHIL